MYDTSFGRLGRKTSYMHPILDEGMLLQVVY